MGLLGFLELQTSRPSTTRHMPLALETLTNKCKVTIGVPELLFSGCWIDLDVQSWCNAGIRMQDTPVPLITCDQAAPHRPALVVMRGDVDQTLTPITIVKEETARATGGIGFWHAAQVAGPGPADSHWHCTHVHHTWGHHNHRPALGFPGATLGSVLGPLAGDVPSSSCPEQETDTCAALPSCGLTSLAVHDTESTPVLYKLVTFPVPQMSVVMLCLSWDSFSSFRTLNPHSSNPGSRTHTTVDEEEMLCTHAASVDRPHTKNAGSVVSPL
ncbi:hypothetical protein J6590_001112 [Homalodisca vitripennis]|nr:hypothetical protein J6590_001112 [Homalodisca vitripennis]